MLTALRMYQQHFTKLKPELYFRLLLVNLPFTVSASGAILYPFKIPLKKTLSSSHFQAFLCQIFVVAIFPMSVMFKGQ